ncbi:hypothetical protein M9H77_03782 [Catharanthus roseus]|uniref:Uncharacterized protein n=1 Tax=Catharanthus roseus TaxID=4058 RepID=A0ACC0CCE2_CATRO|nr:hypothetical protein M9H77_03782 [Catharanthus roseus]
MHVVATLASPSTVYDSTVPISSFRSNMSFGDGTSRRGPPAVIPTTVHDLVNRILAQMTPSPNGETSNWDFPRHNPLIDSYSCAPVPIQFTHLKLDTYDGT